MKRQCIDCQKPTSTGRTGTTGANHLRCLPCEVKRSLSTWQYWRRAR